MNDHDQDHIRYLHWRLKQANKTMGKQGQTIANLRGELARIREEHSKIERGVLRSYEQRERKLMENIADLLSENARLRDKITTLTTPTKEEGTSK